MDEKKGPPPFDPSPLKHDEFAHVPPWAALEVDGAPNGVVPQGQAPMVPGSVEGWSLAIASAIFEADERREVRVDGYGCGTDRQTGFSAVFYLLICFKLEMIAPNHRTGFAFYEAVFLQVDE